MVVAYLDEPSVTSCTFLTTDVFCGRKDGVKPSLVGLRFVL